MLNAIINIIIAVIINTVNAVTVFPLKSKAFLKCLYF